MWKCRLERVAMAVVALSFVAISARATNYFLDVAPRRSPQVHVNGTGLRDYLVSVGEFTDPFQDQRQGELLASNVSNNSTFTLQIELGARQDSTAIGFYNGHDAVPTLMEIFPTRAKRGWFAVLSYRQSPTRAVLNVLDENAALLLTRTYLGADRSAIGFYASDPQGTFYSQDDRNDGKPHFLFLRGTGINSGIAWIGIETGALENEDDDFDDTVLYVESFFFDVTPVQHVRWGVLKERFR